MRIPQIILIVASVVVGAALYLAPISPMASKPDTDNMVAEEVQYDILNDLTQIKNELDSATIALINGQESAFEAGDPSAKLTAADSLVRIYDAIKSPVGSAYHSLQKAKLSNDADSWTEAGERFLLNAKYMGSEVQRKNWFSQSRSCFEKAVELAPNDLDIKVDLGVCLIESATLLGTPPMEGIAMLKSVEQLDPNNIKALINLGYFAIKSGQFDKAEERFNRVLEIDGDHADAYLYLADLHEKQKHFEKAVEALENYKSMTKDPTRIQEVDAYIKELNKNI